MKACVKYYYTLNCYNQKSRDKLNVGPVLLLIIGPIGLRKFSGRNPRTPLYN